VVFDNCIILYSPIGDVTMTIIPSNLPAGVLRANEGEQYTQLGTILTFKSLSHETGGAALIWEQQSPPGAMVPPHIHQTEDEFIYLVEGELEVTIGETTYPVRPGDLVKMPRGVPHGIRMTGTAMTKSLWTVVPAGQMEAFFRALAALPTDQPPNPETFAKIFAEHDIVLLPPPGA
jgi:quercetin dioxygenase-like cupin family protein